MSISGFRLQKKTSHSMLPCLRPVFNTHLFKQYPKCHIQSSHAFNLCSIHTSSNNTPNVTFNSPRPSTCVKHTPLQTTPQQMISCPFSPFVSSDGLPAPCPQRWSLSKDHDSAPMRGCGHCHYPHFIVSSQDVQANAKWLLCSEYHARITFSCSNLHDMTNFINEIP